MGVQASKGCRGGALQNDSLIPFSIINLNLPCDSRAPTVSTLTPLETNPTPNACVILARTWCWVGDLRRRVVGLFGAGDLLVLDANHPPLGLRQPLKSPDGQVKVGDAVVVAAPALVGVGIVWVVAAGAGWSDRMLRGAHFERFSPLFNYAQCLRAHQGQLSTVRTTMLQSGLKQGELRSSTSPYPSGTLASGLHLTS